MGLCCICLIRQLQPLYISAVFSHAVVLQTINFLYQIEYSSVYYQWLAEFQRAGRVSAGVCTERPL